MTSEELSNDEERLKVTLSFEPLHFISLEQLHSHGKYISISTTCPQRNMLESEEPSLEGVLCCEPGAAFSETMCWYGTK